MPVMGWQAMYTRRKKERNDNRGALSMGAKDW
jgi:hypothetical protein